LTNSSPGRREKTKRVKSHKIGKWEPFSKNIEKGGSPSRRKESELETNPEEGTGKNEDEKRDQREGKRIQQSKKKTE